MAKKVLTPEQAELKNIKKEANSSRFTSVIAVLLSIVIAFGVVSIGKSTSEKLVGEAGVVVQTGDTIKNPGNDSSFSSSDVIVDEETGEIIYDSSDVEDEASGEDANAEEEVDPNRELPANPAEWTKTEIVNYYKKAANNSTDVKSIQKMTLRDGLKAEISNNTIQNLVELAMPVMVAALKANSTEFDGITGGYNDLVPSDVKSAKAYKEGKYTIIEMTLVEQKDDAYGDTFKGTVGHGISVVGNIGVVADNFPDWSMDFESAFIELHYKNPVIKVRINEKGVIEKGSWTYEVYVTVRNLRIVKIIVEDATGVIDYVVTTGGGF